MKEFTKGDWNGFAGCEITEDGRQPMISQKDITVDSQSGLIVFDANGIGIFYGESDDYFFMDLKYDLSKLLAESLEERGEITSSYLYTLGFEKH